MINDANFPLNLSFFAFLAELVFHLSPQGGMKNELRQKRLRGRLLGIPLSCKSTIPPILSF